MRKLCSIKNSALCAILNLYEIQHLILKGLPHRDVINFHFAFGIVPTKETVRYRSLSRHLIGDQAWMHKKIKKGYMFTVLSPCLNLVIGTGGKWTPSHRCIKHDCSCLDPRQVIPAVLIVTRNEQFVSCTREFMPHGVFLNRYMDVVVKEKHPSLTVKHRVVDIHSPSFMVSLTIPFHSHSTSLPGKVYSSALGGVIRSAPQGQKVAPPSLLYAHLGKDDDQLHEVGGVSHEVPVGLLSTAKCSFSIRYEDFIYRVCNRRMQDEQLARKSFPAPTQPRSKWTS